ncbi:MAG: PilZ domain-containing protein [Candidatus Abyssobacteria bacterium SURF_17]|uniref:PilZ domain-containing protein n=1 Tax=Candidatus Abyssobacteria bacterium SURF_17 TaxID=2093361 RepID=A0A419F855_9BACT|nr:MAG: PilZ domain-containing protein [Candidatus Abyssubacteria bacterium SURF_17]
MATTKMRSSAAQTYGGPERRKAQRIPVSYPIRLRFISSAGEALERYAQTRNVSSTGVLCGSLDAPEPGMKVDFSIGVPSAYARSLPTAQLNGLAVVARREPPAMNEALELERNIALKFLTRPVLSTELSMFD